MFPLTVVFLFAMYLHLRIRLRKYLIHNTIIASVTYALPHTKINPGKTTVLSWGQGPLMTNHTQIDKAKTEIKFDNSRVSRGQNKGGKVHQPAIDS